MMTTMYTRHPEPRIAAGASPYRSWGFTALLALMLMLCAAAPTLAFEPAKVEGHKPVEAGEHPRLLVRGEAELAALKKATTTDWGKRVLARTQQAQRVLDAAAISGVNRDVLKEAGMKAAGFASLYMITGEAAHAQGASRTAMFEVVNYPLTKDLEPVDRTSRLLGLALAYDMAYKGWDADTRQRVRAFMLAESQTLIDMVGAPDNARADQPMHILAYTAAGMAGLSMLADVDDPQINSQIESARAAVVHYLRTNIGEHGFDRNGESVRQAAMASGILPFVRALKRVTGDDYRQHQGVRDAMLPMLYMTIPRVGMPVLGASTSALDRSDMFAIATSLTPEQHRPAVRWLFDQVGGDRYLGVIRPHQGVYVLQSGIDAIEPRMPSAEQLKRIVPSDKAAMALFRSGWQDTDDIVSVVQNGAIRIVGLGGHWASHRGPHSGIWSHNPGAGRQENIFTFSPEPSRGQSTYRLRSSIEYAGFHGDADTGLASAAFKLQGELTRTRETYTFTYRDNENRRIREERPVAEGGRFTGRRVFGVDYSGKSGAPGLFLVADQIESTSKAPRTWVMHIGAATRFEVDQKKRTFTLEARDATLHGTIVYPSDVTIGRTSNAPHAHFMTIDTSSDRIEVVMTLQRGKAPKVTAGDNGLRGEVTIGNRKVTLDGQQFRFSE